MPINTEIGVTTNTVISLALDNQVQMEVTPKSTGATSYASTKLAVSTNSNDGYALYLQTGSESGSLTGVTSNLGGEISNTTKNNVVLDELETNAYGYALSQTEVDGNTTYSHVPTTNTAVKTTSYVGETSGEYAYGDTYYLAFGTKVGTNLPAGQYAGTVTVSAVANPTTLRSMYDLTYMQDMTSDICTNTKEHYTKQLIDTRDGKSYWVAKLKDGNCWMVQNLALDLSTSRTLTPADTDVTSNYTPTSSTNDIPYGEKKGDILQTNQYSWSVGKIVLATPFLAQTCNNYGNDGLNSAASKDNLGEVCRSSGFVDVSNKEWQPTYSAQKGIFDGKEQALVAVDENAQAYDPHYLVGNLYQHNAATAGTDETVITKNAVASSSICPKGWMLPASGKNDANQPIINLNQSKASFYQLLLAYGYPETGEYIVNNDSPQTAIKDPSITTEDNLASSPMYFVRSGVVDLGNDYLRLAGSSGYYWSSTVNTFEHAFGLYFFRSILNPALSHNRHYGFSVRCVAR